MVGKSTVPVGTALQLQERLRGLAPAGDHVEIAWNPEFLREGFAVEDTLRPDRLVFGVQSARALEVLEQVYAIPLTEATPMVRCDLATAELIKTAANAFLATKISFINSMAQTCQAAGGDVVLLAEWPEFRYLDPEALGDLAKNKIIIDGRLKLHAPTWADAGWKVVQIGRAATL